MKVIATVLFATAVFKLLDANVDNRYFLEPNGLLTFLTNRQLTLLASAFEIAVACYLWIEKCLKKRALIVLWFCGIVGIYKTSLHFTYNVVPCSCLGILGRALQFSNAQLELLTWSILLVFSASAVVIYLAGGSARVDARWGLDRRDSD